MDRGAWWATVCGVAEIQTRQRLSNKWKKPVWKGYILYLNLEHSGRDKIIKTSKEISGRQELGKRGKQMGRTQDFLHSEAILYVTLVDISHNKIFQVHPMYNTKNEPLHKLWTLGGNDVSV